MNGQLDIFQLTKAQPVVYIIFSIWHHHRYVGSTEDFIRRMGEHFRGSWDATADENMQRVHKCLNRLGPSSFAILPLCTSSAIDLRRIERLYIQRLQPTLNVLHTVRGRRMVRVLQEQKRKSYNTLLTLRYDFGQRTQM